MTGIVLLLHFLLSPCEATVAIDCFWEFDRGYPVSSYAEVHKHLHAQQENPDIIKTNGGMAFVLGSMRVHREENWCEEDSETSRVLVIVDVIRAGSYHVFCAQQISSVQSKTVCKKLKKLYNLNFSFRHSDDYPVKCRYKLCVFFNVAFFTLETNAYSTLSGVLSHNAVGAYQDKLRRELYIDPQEKVEDTPIQIICLRNNISTHLFYIVNTCLPHQRDYMISFNKKYDMLGMRTMANCENVRLLHLKNAIHYTFERSKRDRKRLKYYFGPVHYFVAGDLGVRRGMIDESYLHHILTVGRMSLLRQRADPFNLMRDQNSLVYDHLPFRRATGENFKSGFTFVRRSFDKTTRRATDEHFCDMSDYIYYTTTCKVKPICFSMLRLSKFSDYYKLPLNMSFWIGTVFDVSNSDTVR